MKKNWLYIAVAAAVGFLLWKKFGKKATAAVKKAATGTAAASGSGTAAAGTTKSTTATTTSKASTSTSTASKVTSGASSASSYLSTGTSLLSSLSKLFSGSGSGKGSSGVTASGVGSSSKDVLADNGVSESDYAADGSNWNGVLDSDIVATDNGGGDSFDGADSFDASAADYGWGGWDDSNATATPVADTIEVDPGSDKAWDDQTSEFGW